MEKLEAIENLGVFIIEKDLPRTEMGVVGVRCPYCGKSDRIFKLESPEELTGQLGDGEVATYRILWETLHTEEGTGMGVCRFCRNPLKLFFREGRAGSLDNSLEN